MEEEARPATGQAGELRLLFLDIDGVISIDLMHNTSHEEALVQLGRIVTTTAAKIVLSSTWRRSEHGMAHLNENFEKRGTILLRFTFAPGTRSEQQRKGIGTIFSITPPEMGRTRAQEIMKWHEMHMPILKVTCRGTLAV